MRKLGDTITYDFTTHNPTTGTVSDADSLPTCAVFEDDNDTSILTPVVVKRVNKTGNYRVSIVADTGNGFEVGKSYNVIVSATIGVLAKACIASFSLEAKSIDDLDVSIQAIKAKTDNLPSDPADESLLEAAIAAIPTSTAPTKEEIADQVWDELKAGHITANTMGKLMQDIYTALGSLSIDLGGVWDVQLALHTATGTFGARINNLGTIVFEAS